MNREAQCAAAPLTAALPWRSPSGDRHSFPARLNALATPTNQRGAFVVPSDSLEER
jgi:hypothetical protein